MEVSTNPMTTAEPRHGLVDGIDPTPGLATGYIGDEIKSYSGIYGLFHKHINRYKDP